MNDVRPSDDRFERDLRGVLEELAPSTVPAHVREAIGRIPGEAPISRRTLAWRRTRSLAAGLAAAATTLLVVVGLVVLIAHPFGLGRLDGTGPGTSSPSPSATPAAPIRDEYQVMPSGGRQPTADDLALIATIVTNRLQATGLASSEVSVVPPDRIVVLLPAVEPATLDVLRQLIGTTGRLDFVPLGQTPAQQDQELPPATINTKCSDTVTVNCVLFSGDQIAAASIGANQAGQRTVDFVLKDTGKNLFANYTADHVGDFFAIVLDGKVISAPTINEAIPGGQVQISQNGIGGYPLADAQNLVTILQFGQLPFPLQEVAFGP